LVIRNRKATRLSSNARAGRSGAPLKRLFFVVEGHSNRVRVVSSFGGSVRMSGIIYRIATEADVPGIMAVRTFVAENHLSVEELAQRGITNASIAASFRADSKGWVAEHDSQIIALSIADRKTHSIFALFVLPAFDGRGIGGKLLDFAVEWLWDN